MALLTEPCHGSVTSVLPSPLKQVVQRHNHTPFLATMAIRSGLTPSNTDKLRALVDGRPEMLSSEAWRVIMPHLLDKVGEPVDPSSSCRTALRVYLVMW